MSSISAAIIVIGFLLIIGLPVLWWIFFKMDSQEILPDSTKDFRKLMSHAEIKRIETSLGVALPEEYKKKLKQNDQISIDATTMLDDPDQIIEATFLYRNGFEGLPQWPNKYIYFGDEADACPYVIDCSSGEILRLDKGNIELSPLERYKNISELLAKLTYDE